MTTGIHDILKQYWGYDSFRPLQEDIIYSVLSGHDTLGLLPTGGGKSITFQVPAIALGGLCIVVSPLISLMKDQIDNLKSRGIKAAAVYVGMTHQEILDTYDQVISQKYQFLYLSPERLETRLFQAKLQYMDVSLLVVDEAHCISQWGYDFRPPYLRIAELRKLLPSPTPCLALTATATAEVIEDIQKRLNFRPKSQVFKASFVRPNLTYSVLNTTDKLGTVLRLIGTTPKSVIIFVRSRKKTFEVAEKLCAQGIIATFYHAGLSPKEKTQRQDAWIKGDIPVIVATNAFGMGIDKPDVRLVIHLDLPPSIEEYFQEAGRAGRDRQPAEAWILYENKDRHKLIKHLADEYPERDYIRLIYQKLANFFQLAIGTGYNSMYEFEIMQFCAAYHLELGPTYYALKLLDLAGYIYYNEEPETKSRLMFKCNREHLYHLDRFDNECQRIIQAILRHYTGVFADYVFFKEEDLMRYTGFDRELLYQKLLLLSRFHILHYVPARQKPMILFLTPRLDNDELRIPRIIYEDRQNRQETRIQAMINYVESSDQCRLVTLLKYFGEELDKTCGSCDVCKSQSADVKGQLLDLQQFIRKQIINLLKSHQSLTPQQVIDKISVCPEYDIARPELISETIRELVAEETITLSQLKLSLKDF